jgi:hypothetical protein
LHLIDSVGFPPFHRHFTALKKQQLENKQLLFLRCLVPHLHTVTSCVRSGLCILNTASFRYTPQATFHCIPAILCLQPSVFSAVAPSHSHRAWLRLPHLPYLRSIHFQLSIIPLSIIDWFGRFALNQGTPPKRRLPSIFYPPFHAHSRYVSLCTSAQLSRLWWLLDCRNPAAALLIRKKKFLALKRGTTFFAPCGAWGC